MILVFGGFELDEERCELRRDGRPVALQHKPLQLLAYLVRQRGRNVSKVELFTKVWPDVVVSDAALTSALRDVRRVLGDDAREPSWIQTTRGLGFRFVGRAEEVPSDGAAVSASGVGSLVGRADALAQLDAALDTAWRGRTRIALLSGEAGIGKTRLAQEVARRAEARGWRTLWGHCAEGPGAPAFGPWIGVLRAALVGEAEQRIARRLGERAAWLGPLLRAPLVGGEATLAEMADSADARALLFDAVASLLRALANAVPLLVVIDDLQWADGASLELLRFLAMHLGDARLLLVATCRDTEIEPGDPLAASFARLLREESVQRIPIGGLAPDESRDLIARLVDHEPDPGFARALHERTLGNPLFIEETLREIAPSISAERPRSDWTRAGALGVAKSIRQLLARRVAALPESCRALLEAAAVIGLDFDTALLARVAALGDQALSDVLHRAESLVVREPASPGLYRFRHPLIRETIYGAIDIRRCRDLHRAVGEALEWFHAADPEPPLAALAHHFGEAGLEKAFGYSMRAARASFERFAYEDAAAHFAEALEIQERVGTPDAKLRCELLLGMGQALHLAGEPARARESFLRAVALARAAAAPDLLARAAIGVEQERWILVDAPASRSIPLLEEARASLGDGDPALRARLLARLAKALAAARDPRDESVVAEALAVARASRDATALGLALAAHIDVTWRPGRLVQNTALARELAAITVDPAQAHQGFLLLFDCALQAADVAAAERAIEQARSAAGALRIPWQAVSLQVIAGRLAMLRGLFDEAEAAAWAGIREAQRLPSGNLANGAMGLLYSVRALQGRLGELLPALEASATRPQPLRLDDAAGETPDEGEIESGSRTWRAGLALVRFEAGDVAGARAAFGRLAQARFLPRDAAVAEPIRLAMLAQLCWLLGDEHAARVLADEIRPWLPQNLVGPAAFVGSSCHWVGALAVTQGHGEEAIELLDGAIDIYRRMEALPWIAWAQAIKVQALARVGSTTACAEAAVLVDEARATAQRLGMPGLAARLPSV